MQSRSRLNRHEPELARLLERAIGTPSRGSDGLEEREDALRQLGLHFRTSHQWLESMPPNAASSMAAALVAHPQSVLAISRCLLQIISNSSPAVLKRQCSAIVNPIIASLSHLAPLQTKQILPSLTISYQLRILATMITKVGSSALIDLPAQVAHIRSCYQRPRFVQEPSFVSGKSSGAGWQQSTPCDTPRIPQNSVQSTDLYSSSNLDVGTIDEHSTQLRLDALALLKTIAELDPKALHSFWAQLLPAHKFPIHQTCTLVDIIEQDPEISVRIRACGVLRLMLTGAGPYLAVAEEHTTKVSFISLSAQIASITIELHDRLGALLCKQVTSHDLIKSLLEACVVIVSNSAYQRIKTPILEVVLKPIVVLLSNDDVRVIAKARSALRDIFNNTHSHRLIMMASSIVEQVVKLGCERVRSEVCEADLTDWWGLLAASLTYLDFKSAETVQILNLRSEFIEEPTTDDLSTAKLSFLSHLAIVYTGDEFDEIYLRWLRKRLRNGGLQALSDIISKTSEGVIGRVSEELRRDLLDVLDDIVAVRLVGLIVSKKIGKHPIEWLISVSVTILADLERLRQSESPNEKMNSTRSWTLANCAETLVVHKNTRQLGLLDLDFWLRSVAVSERLIKPPSQLDSQRINGVRICGVGVSELFRRASSVTDVELQSIVDCVESGTETLCKSLSDRMPKVQWNAVASLRQILMTVTEGPPALRSTVVYQITCNLCTCLKASESYKVRIQICLTFQIIPTLTALVFDVVRGTLKKLEADLASGTTIKKELDHAQRLHLEVCFKAWAIG
ncbi:hypothetical protein CROQUDRAFT_657399 [Cronartium quercuum f. sp. fusiforme G11]|uniref:DUF4042 domain-containing protein n=1 Tax=Cronartium quercuum f. sp. fusiforme G11 TaxID=708437 RepID=A0A9P6TBM3_9BASI|nr:hypothetical protein CROQUDRAFT_657399 [Cronartium quercuum f. sp. fusiforme G11]